MDWFVFFVLINMWFEIFQYIDFVYYQQGWDFVSVDFFKNCIYCFDVFLYMYICCINDVQQ